MVDFRKIRIIIFSVFVSLVLYLPAYSQEPPFAYITNFDEGADGEDIVCKVDLLTNTEVAVIDVGCVDNDCEPYWIAASANQNLVAASLHNDNGIALIDAETMSHIGNVSCLNLDVDFDEPEAIAVNSTGTLVYVADEDQDNLFVVDVATQTCVQGPIDLNPGSPDPPICESPENMVISADDSTLYIACATGNDSTVISVDTTTFAITQIATGLDDSHGIELNPAETLLFYPDAVFPADEVIQYSIAAGMPTGITYDGCGFMQNGAFSPSGDRFYCVEEDRDLFIYSTALGGAPLATVDLGDRNAWGVAVSPDGARAFVPVNDVLKVVDTVTFDVTEIPLTCTIGRDIVIVQELPPPPVAMVPTLSQWGLIAMAGVLGLLGLFAIRRKNAVA